MRQSQFKQDTRTTYSDCMLQLHYGRFVLLTMTDMCSICGARRRRMGTSFPRIARQKDYASCHLLSCCLQPIVERASCPGRGCVSRSVRPGFVSIADDRSWLQTVDAGWYSCSAATSPARIRRVKHLPCAWL